MAFVPFAPRPAFVAVWFKAAPDRGVARHVLRMALCPA
jgi:hypothetical protein